MWWCSPDGTRSDPDRHRFTEVLPRTMRPAGAEDWCASCTTELAAHEGPAHARTYEYNARVIASALVAVGSGVSYKRAAATARHSNGWSRRRHNEQLDKWRGKTTRYGRNGQLAGDWVGLYGPVVTAPLEQRSWPDVIALDDLPIAGTTEREKRLKAQHVAETLAAVKQECAADLRRGGQAAATARARIAKAEKEARKKKSAARWGVYGAYAYPEVSEPGAPDGPGKQRGWLFDLHAVPALTADNAVAWLRSIPGRPKYVIADGARSWPAILAEAWPEVVDHDTGEVLQETPRLLPCTWHLARLMTGWLRASSIVTPEGEPLPRAVTDARRQKQWERARLAARQARAARAGRSVSEVRAEEPEERISGALAPGEKHPLIDLAHKALRGPEEWDALVAGAYKWQAHPLIGFLESGSWIRDELAVWPDGVARSVGGLEGALRKVKFALKGRDHLLLNATRTNRMLRLMVLHAQARDDVDAYTRRLRNHLAPAGGKAAPQRDGVVNGPRLQRR